MLLWWFVTDKGFSKEATVEPAGLCGDTLVSKTRWERQGDWGPAFLMNTYGTTWHIRSSNIYKGLAVVEAQSPY